MPATTAHPDSPARPHRLGAAVNGVFRLAPASCKPGQTVILRPSLTP